MVRLEPAGGKPGPALGVFAGSQYAAATQRLEPGDFLVLFTDGLYELEGPQGHLMTQDQLAAELAPLCGLEPGAILDRLIQRCLTYSASGKFEDDVCLVGVEFRHP